MPRLHADIMLASFTKYANVEVVCTIEGREDCAAALKDLAPDVILIGLSRDEGDAAVSATLRTCPNSCVIGLTTDGRRVCIHFFHPHRIVLEGEDPDRIASVILDRFLHPTV